MQTARTATATYCMQAEREAVKSGLSGPGYSAAEAALREHFSGEEGTKAVEQQVHFLHLHCFHLFAVLSTRGCMQAHQASALDGFTG